MDMSIFILIMSLHAARLYPASSSGRNATQEQERQALLSQHEEERQGPHPRAASTARSCRSAENEDEITVKIDDNVRVKMVKNAILRNLTNEEAKAAEAAKKAAKEAAKGGKAKDPRPSPPRKAGRERRRRAAGVSRLCSRARLA